MNMYSVDAFPHIKTTTHRCHVPFKFIAKLTWCEADDGIFRNNLSEVLLEIICILFPV